jgi:hypothetical protein
MDAIKFFKQFKLSNSVFNSSYKVDVSYGAKIPKDALDKESIKRMTDNLASFIISKQQSSITKEEGFPEIEYKCELLVLKVVDFKTIVEAAIQMMPDEAIRKIKAGEE